MTARQPVCSLLCLALGLGAAEADPASVAPAPMPPPPAAAEAAPAAAEAAPEPVVTDPPPSGTMQTAAPASAGQRPRFGAEITLAGGYDSNALLLNDLNPVVTDLDGPALWADLALRWRIISDRDHRLEATARLAYDGYDSDEARQMHYGANLVWAKRYDRWLPGAAFGGYRYHLDGEAAATVGTATLSANRAATTWAALPMIEALWIDYDDYDIASGILVAAHYQHWFLLRPQDPRCRLEAGLRIGQYAAEEDFESFLTVRPVLTLRWHPAGTGEAGRWDFAAALSADLRSYDKPVPIATDEETSTTFGIRVEGDRRLSPWLRGGIFAGYGQRDSNFSSRDYDRFQIGLRLGANL